MRKTITPPKAVFFDWDGTLVDTLVFLRKAHSYARNQLGLPDLSIEQFEGYFGMPREVLYQEIYGEEKEIAKAHFETYVRANHLKDVKPLDGAQQCLEILVNRGITMGAVTNKKPEFIVEEIKSFGWEGYFSSVVGAGEAANDKPAADPLLLAIKRTNIAHDISDIWFVGDSETDLACARAANAVAIFIGDASENKVLIEQYKPAIVVRNCHALCEFLLQSLGKSLKQG